MDYNSNEAVMFFAEGDVSKEMLYPEFEAVLDCVVAVEDFKDKRIAAVYLRLDGSLTITAAVFFYIAFDAEGYADKNWNMPLQQLADGAGPGPNLGGGAIKLCCRSQCSISWHQRGLWDPDSDASVSTFELLKEKLQRNRLGLLLQDFDDCDDDNRLYPWSDSGGSDDPEVTSAKQQQTQLNALRDEHRLRVATMKSEAQDHMQALRQHYQDELQQSDRLLQASKQLFKEEKDKNVRMHSTLELQSEDIERLRQHYQQALDNHAVVSGDSLGSLEETYGLELRAKVATATRVLEDKLNMRDVELFYRDEKILRLMAEVSELQADTEQLQDASGQQFVDRLEDSGIRLLACQPDSPPIPLPLQDLPEYLQQPLQYVAQKSAAAADQLQQWLQHVAHPVCTFAGELSERCAEPVLRIDDPGAFYCGDSDRCQQHKSGLQQPTGHNESRTQTD